MTSDRQWLQAAIELSRQCPPSTTAFSVGAIVVDESGSTLADGYSRRDDSREHAEEAALRSIGADDVRLERATIYSSLEPCSVRKSRPRSCAELIVTAGIRRVVFALREPPIFVAGAGADMLRAAGVEVVEISQLAAEVRAINAQVLSPR